MRGKAYAWWIFESFSLKNVNTASYASLTRALLRRFGRRIHETHMVELNKGTQTKPLHENAIPLQKTMEEAENLHHTLPEENISSHTFEQGSMEISFSKRDTIIGRLPIHVAEIEGNNTVSSRDYLVPHAEEGGALAPSRGILASLQGSPQDLICGDQGTTHVPLLRRCGTMETQGGGREKNQ